MADKRKVGSRRKPSTRIKRTIIVDLNASMRAAKRTPEVLALLRKAKELVNLAKKAEAEASA